MYFRVLETGDLYLVTAREWLEHSASWSEDLFPDLEDGVSGFSVFDATERSWLISAVNFSYMVSFWEHEFRCMRSCLPGELDDYSDSTPVNISLFVDFKTEVF